MMCKGSGKSLLFKDCGCGCNGKKQEEKFMASLMAGAVFFLIANPEVYRVTRKLIGNWVATPTGCPSTKGLLLHAVVFFLITWVLMNVQGLRLRRENFIPCGGQRQLLGATPARPPDCNFCDVFGRRDSVGLRLGSIVVVLGRNHFDICALPDRLLQQVVFAKFCRLTLVTFDFLF